MDEEEKHYGRRRVKKTKPALNSEATGENEARGDESKASAKNRESTEVTLEKKGVTEKTGSRSGFSRETKENRSERRPRGKSERKPRDKFDKDRDKSRPRRAQQHDRSSDRSRVNVSVIIPAYNEEENIIPLAEMFDEVIRKEGKDWEVVLVNDGSTDKTFELCKEISNKYRWLRVVGYSKNRGLTYALNTGFQASRGSLLVFYPADLQYHAQDIPKMLAKLYRGTDLVTDRAHSDPPGSRPGHRVETGKIQKEIRVVFL